MTTLAAYAAFLTARWDELEAVAQEARDDFGYAVEGNLRYEETGYNTLSDLTIDPGFVLADLAAKRAVLALHLPSVESEPGDTECKWDIDTLRYLAEPFRDHPDHPANQETRD